MKKMILIFLSIVTLIFLNSCKKTRTCECEYFDSSSKGDVVDIYSPDKMTKIKGEEWCDSQSLGDSFVCNLK